MAKEIIFTENAPSPIGPYSQAVLAGNMLFVSGQISIDPATGEMKMDSIEDETAQVMYNIRAILEAAGLDFSDVVKCSIFLENMDDFNRVNEVYGDFFENDSAPARETVEVSRLPKGVNVEISCIAVI